jgi:hypothetical protein
MYWPRTDHEKDRYCSRCGCKLWPWDTECPNAECRQGKLVVLTEYDRKFLAELRIKW